MQPDAIFSPHLSLAEFPPTLWEEILAGSYELFLLLKLTYTDETGRFAFHLDTCHRYCTSFSHMMLAPNDIWPQGFDTGT